jgi:organic hydroperoxide reductase OsmC/OhrA
MADITVESTCDEGYAVSNVVDGWELLVDATGEEGPTAQQVLAADYASCYVPAFRVAAQKEGIDDVGRIEVQVEADLDEDDDLESIAFHIECEASLGEVTSDVVARGEDICHVHSALQEELHADITVTDDAF